MHEDSPGKPAARVAVPTEPASPADPANRLQSLLSSFAVLRTDGRALLKQIRGSMDEMRELRGRLQNGRSASSHVGGNEQDRGTELHLEYGLTHREAEVAILLAEGLSNSAVAEALGVSAHTARHHTQRVLSKLNVHSRAAAGAKIRGGWPTKGAILQDAGPADESQSNADDDSRTSLRLPTRGREGKPAGS